MEKVILAQTGITNPALGTGLKNILSGPNPGETFLGKFLGNLIGLLLIAAAITFFFILIIGGIQWIFSGGDKAGTEAARGRITTALMGLVLVFAAWAIIKVVETFLGITIISGPITIPTL